MIGTLHKWLCTECWCLTEQQFYLKSKVKSKAHMASDLQCMWTKVVNEYKYVLKCTHNVLWTDSLILTIY